MSLAFGRKGVPTRLADGTERPPDLTVDVGEARGCAVGAGGLSAFGCVSVRMMTALSSGFKLFKISTFCSGGNR